MIVVRRCSIVVFIRRLVLLLLLIRFKLGIRWLHVYVCLEEKLCSFDSDIETKLIN